MATNRPCESLLQLLDQRIDQLDAFDRRDASDLDTLLRCRERAKFAIRTGDDHDNYIEILRAGAEALGSPALIQELLSPSWDVV